MFGLPKEEIDELVEKPAETSERDHIKQLVFRYASYVVKKELPSNISIHAGGVLITEKPIYAYTATDLPPKGYPKPTVPIAAVASIFFGTSERASRILSALEK